MKRVMACYVCELTAMTVDSAVSLSLSALRIRSLASATFLRICRGTCIDLLQHLHCTAGPYVDYLFQMSIPLFGELLFLFGEILNTARYILHLLCHTSCIRWVRILLLHCSQVFLTKTEPCSLLHQLGEVGNLQLQLVDCVSGPCLFFVSSIHHLPQLLNLL